MSISPTYEDLLALSPPRGANARNEPQIITDPAQRDRIAEALAAEAGVDIVGVPAELRGPWRTGIMFRDRDLTLIRDAILYPDGRCDLRSRMLYTGAEGPIAGVLLLGIVHERVAMVRQWRHATQDWTLEAPRGRLQHHAEGAEGAVMRELSEEMGAIIVGRLTPLGMLTSETGYISGTCLAYTAEIAMRHAPSTVDDRDMFRAPKFIPFADMPAHIASGEVHDGLTLAAFARAVALGVLPSSLVVSGSR